MRGGNLVLTIDHRVQFLVEKLLKENIERVEAEAGQVIVVDVTNGDILAMANYPYFDPNQYHDQSYAILKNSCVVDIFEPGSTFKLFTYAAALEEGVVTPGMTIQVPETIAIAGRRISEANERKPDDPSIYPASDILKKSMNVGTVLLAQN